MDKYIIRQERGEQKSVRGREVLRERVCGGGEASRAAVLSSEPMGVRCGIMSAQDCAARSAECAPRQADKIIERNGAL